MACRATASHRTGNGALRATKQVFRRRLESNVSSLDRRKSPGGILGKAFISRAAKTKLKKEGGSPTGDPPLIWLLKWAARRFAKPPSVQLPVLNAADACADCALGMLMYPTTLSLPIWLTTSSRGTRVPRV